MLTLFAIHSMPKNGLFSRAFYYTDTTKGHKGDEVYIIASDKLRAPNYFLEGLYNISDIEQGSRKKRKLLLKPIMTKIPSPSISAQSWYDRTAFRRFFANGQSLNPVRPAYEARFQSLLRNASGSIDDLTYSSEDAIDDLGFDRPEVSIGFAKRYKRDPNVRAAVLSRARGKCEYCLRVGFTRDDGTPYLESHHIIALAADGADRMTNVIALCAEDHRRAHFGVKREELEQQMEAIVAKLERG